MSARKGNDKSYIVPSDEHCEYCLIEYMIKHAHEGTASMDAKAKAFKEDYWGFEKNKNPVTIDFIKFLRKVKYM